MFIDHDFLRHLEYGTPPTSGIGFGLIGSVCFIKPTLDTGRVIIPDDATERIETAEE